MYDGQCSWLFVMTVTKMIKLRAIVGKQSTIKIVPIATSCCLKFSVWSVYIPKKEHSLLILSKLVNLSGYCSSTVHSSFKTAKALVKVSVAVVNKKVYERDKMS